MLPFPVSTPAALLAAPETQHLHGYPFEERAGSALAALWAHRSESTAPQTPETQHTAAQMAAQRLSRMRRLPAEDQPGPFRRCPVPRAFRSPGLMPCALCQPDPGLRPVPLDR